MRYLRAQRPARFLSFSSRSLKASKDSLLACLTRLLRSEPRERCHDRLRLLDDDHVTRRGDADELGAGNRLAEGLAMGGRDHPVALAPDQHGPGANPVEAL